MHPIQRKGKLRYLKKFRNTWWTWISLLNKFICAEDWNLIFDATRDSFGGKAVLKRKVIFQLKSIMSSYDLVDIWRVRNPTLRQFKWRRKTPLQMSRRDFFLISYDLQFGVDSRENFVSLK